MSNDPVDDPYKTRRGPSSAFRRERAPVELPESLPPTKRPLRQGGTVPVSHKTWAAHDASPAAGWLPTQYWSWDDGDAIVALVGRLPGPVRTYVTIRSGEQIRTVEAVGLNDAMRAIGLKPEDFKVQP